MRVNSFDELTPEKADRVRHAREINPKLSRYLLSQRFNLSRAQVNRALRGEVKGSSAGGARG